MYHMPSIRVYCISVYTEHTDTDAVTMERIRLANFHSCARNVSDCAAHTQRARRIVWLFYTSYINSTAAIFCFILRLFRSI